MCGIFSLIGKIDNSILIQYFKNILPRGPDNESTLSFKNMFWGFHRLSIVDTSNNANQPLKHKTEDVWVICNGEIYNYKSILDTLCITEPNSGSDCESILYLYVKYGIERTIELLDGVFAFILYDKRIDTVFVGRDPFGVRPLFYARLNHSLIFASEIKAIPNDCVIKHVEPGSYITIKDATVDTSNYKITTTRYYEYIYPIKFRWEDIRNGINIRLRNAVLKRLMSDRPIGCLLSGGLDSSLVAGIAAEKLGKKLHTFSIGMNNSPDIKYAKMVADYIGSTHHEVILSKDDFLKTIPEVIETIESYDTTTVRASVGHYLLAKYIKQYTDITVILGGEGSDEVTGGYRYFKNAPDCKEFNIECRRLLADIHIFDVLRADRCVSSKWSLEARVPFLDKEFVSYYMSIPPELRFGGNKTLLREAFFKDKIIPDEVVFRPKEAFSDGVSSENDSWHKTINTYIENIVFDTNIPVNMSKEDFYYFTIFLKNMEQKILV